MDNTTLDENKTEQETLQKTRVEKKVKPGGRMRNLQRLCHQIATEKGFWEKDRNNGELIALIHSELSEALEELRRLDVDWKHVGEEMADAVIRILDFCEAREIDLETAVWEKMDINKRREYKHGKQF